MPDKASGAQRKGPRARVLLKASVSKAGREIDAFLRDLSESGVLLEAPLPPPPGAEVIFNRGDTSVPAHVAWVKGKRFGLEFDAQIEPSEVLVHIGPPISVPPPKKFRRPGLASEPLSHHELKLAESWGETGPFDVLGE